MAAAALRRYSVAMSTNFATTIVPAVPTARALVVSKILINAQGSSTVSLSFGGAPILSSLGMVAGQVYTETGLVLLAGETMTALVGTINVITISVYGEEVDN